MTPKTEELVSILTAYRFIAMLMMLLIGIMSYYGIAIEPKVAELIREFLMGFLGINTVGYVTKKVTEAIKSKNSYDI